MRDSLYSTTLLVALMLAAVGAGSGVIELCRPGRWSRRIALWVNVLALLVGAFSFTVHLLFGHGPTAQEPMAIFRFLRFHPAYGVVLVFSLFGLGVRLLSGARA